LRLTSREHLPAWYGSSAELRAKAKREFELADEALLVRFGGDFQRVSSGAGNGI